MGKSSFFRGRLRERIVSVFPQTPSRDFGAGGPGHGSPGIEMDYLKRTRRAIDSSPGTDGQGDGFETNAFLSARYRTRKQFVRSPRGFVYAVECFTVRKSHLNPACKFAGTGRSKRAVQ